MKGLNLILFAFLFTFLACSTDKKEENKQSEPINEASQIIEQQNFTVVSGEETEKEGMPQVPVFIKSELINENLLLTTENGFIVIEADSREAYGMPKEVAFSFNTYYAGAGYLYYGNVEDNQLKVYRKFYGEESESPEKYELFKTFELNSGKLEEVK